jgi:aminopeptidase N
MGKYPFYEDGYKLVDVPYLGMEHQSNVAYGNKYLNGYLGRDQSKTGWGLLWDFIIVHESGHEWFGNNITSKDIADMWIHEGFTTYTETLLTQWQSGNNAGNEYSLGIRKNIRNNAPIIGAYDVQDEGSGDMYPKGAAMIHNIRMAMNNDTAFRAMLRAMNKTFYHQTITTKDVELFMSKYAGFSLAKTFDQYLRTTQVPSLEYYFSADGKALFYRWIESVEGFDMPLLINLGNSMLRIQPKYKEWSNIQLTAAPINDLQMKALVSYFYIELMERKEMTIKVN